MIYTNIYFFELEVLVLLLIVSLCKPILGIALASTMLIQGYVSIRIGVMKSRTANDLGIAGIMAAIVATRGAAWGLWHDPIEGN